MKRILALLAVGATAHADPLDELGLGAPSAGMANARTATAIGADAAHADPAAVALALRPEVLVGWQYQRAHLSLDGHDAGVADAHGTAVGLAFPFALTDDVRLGVGFAAYLPDQFLARIELVPVSEPHFTRFETQSQRIVVEPTASIAFGDVAIGLGASVLADARSRELAFDVGVVGGSAQGNANLDVALPVRAAPLASVHWRPTRWIEAALTFRGELSLDLALDIRANVNVPGVVTGDAIVSLRSVSYFTPMRASAAVAVHPRDDLTIAADLAWERWSALGSGAPDLRVLLALSISPPLVSSTQPPASFGDTVAPRLGTEWRTGALALRAGLAYLPSPVPPQTGLTSFADGARVSATGGAGWRFAPRGILAQPIDVDLAIGWSHVAHALVQKDPRLQPGGAFSSGGDFAQVSISSTVRF